MTGYEIYMGFWGVFFYLVGAGVIMGVLFIVGCAILDKKPLEVEIGKAKFPALLLIVFWQLALIWAIVWACTGGLFWWLPNRAGKLVRAHRRATKERSSGGPVVAVPKMTVVKD